LPYDVGVSWLQDLRLAGPLDPGIPVSAAAVPVLAALLASYLPARRATRVDPVRTLRVD
jgi:ABC-type lipoprotein release transport system permease subunit